MNHPLDRLTAVLVLPLLIPFLLLISLIIVVVDRYSPFFTAKRIGKNGRPFTCIKLQTLKPTTNEKDYTNVKRDQERLTKLGRFLRNRGWDELPQIFNIINGDMNFIGPRPIPYTEYEALAKRYPNHKLLIEDWKKQRQLHTPGLSGWHQIHLPDRNIVKYDMEYFSNQTLQKKAKIIIASILILVVGKSAYFGVTIPDTYVYSLDNK